MSSINLGSAKVTPISGISTKEVVRRANVEVPGDASKALDKAYNTERGFYEKGVFGFAEKLLKGSRWENMYTAARAEGDARSLELESRGMKGRFGAPGLRKLLRSMRATLRQSLPDSDLQSLLGAYQQITEKLFAASRGKFGIVGSEIDSSGMANLRINQVSGPAYFGLAKTGMPESWRALSMATGVCMIVKTNDKQLLVQYRTSGNAQYSEIPGASIAGMLDAKLPDGYANKVAKRHAAAIGGNRSSKDASEYATGLLSHVNAETVFAQIKAEAREELGLREKLTGAKVVGIAEDLTKPHHEIIFLGEVDLTAAEVAARAKAKYDGDTKKYDTPEWCVGIPATGEAVAILLTKVKSPLPPTHAAAFLAAGKALVAEAHGEKAAAQWETDTTIAYRENFEVINALCIAHTGKPYDPMKKAVAEQGLGNPIQLLKEELAKAELQMTVG